jgi:hypothetical protein
MSRRSLAVDRDDRDLPAPSGPNEVGGAPTPGEGNDEVGSVVEHGQVPDRASCPPVTVPLGSEDDRGPAPTIRPLPGQGVSPPSSTMDQHPPASHRVGQVVEHTVHSAGVGVVPAPAYTHHPHRPHYRRNVDLFAVHQVLPVQGSARLRLRFLPAPNQSARSSSQGFRSHVVGQESSGVANPKGGSFLPAGSCPLTDAEADSTHRPGSPRPPSTDTATCPTPARPCSLTFTGPRWTVEVGRRGVRPEAGDDAALVVGSEIPPLLFCFGEPPSPTTRPGSQSLGLGNTQLSLPLPQDRRSGGCQ